MNKQRELARLKSEFLNILERGVKVVIKDSDIIPPPNTGGIVYELSFQKQLVVVVPDVNRDGHWTQLVYKPCFISKAGDPDDEEDYVSFSVEVQKELADAQQRISELESRVVVLEEEKSGLAAQLAGVEKALEAEVEAHRQSIKLVEELRDYLINQEAYYSDRIVTLGQLDDQLDALQEMEE